MAIDKDRMVELFTNEEMTTVDGQMVVVPKSIGTFNISSLEQTKEFIVQDRDNINARISDIDIKIQMITDIQNTEEPTPE